MESNFSSDNQNHQIQPGGFDFGRYSVYAGVAGLFLLSFSGVYITFFFGVVGLACALVAKRASGKASVPGIILCSLCIVLSLLFFFSMLCFYDLISDPVLGPRWSRFLQQLMEPAASSALL